MVVTFFVLSNDMINYQATPDMSASKWYRLQESNANDVLNKEHTHQTTIYSIEISIPQWFISHVAKLLFILKLQEILDNSAIHREF